VGFFRLLLAMTVAGSHMGARFFELDIGTIATVPFFIISGYSMTILINEYYFKAELIGSFFGDRCLRLIPQFFVYVVCSVFLFLWLDEPRETGASNVATRTLFIITVMMPQVWSLWLEFMFYLAIPLLILPNNRKYILIAFVLSMLVFLVSFFNLSESVLFHYSLLPGSLFIFLIGWSFTEDLFEMRVVRGIFFLIMGALLPFFLIEIYRVFPKSELIMGCLIGYAAVFFFVKIEFHGYAKRLEVFCGNLSYGVFLNHTLFILLFLKLGISSYVFLILASILTSYVSYICVEKPFFNFRRSLRNRLT
jgi:peptidoglycan/LPS O-acetylase OafA/YrhL